MPYLRNTWYVFGWASEASNGAMLARTILGEPIVLFRDEQGAPHALSDRCPHRFAPLHMGVIRGGVVQCAYHGLEFDGQGACVKNPHGAGHIPAAAKVPTYPVVERHSLLWIWMGQTDLADSALIPNFEFLDQDRWEVGQGYLLAQANYLLEVDNIMDLSHIEFLHTSTLGSPGISAAEAQVTREGSAIWSKRLIKDHILSDFMYQATGIPHGAPVDRWIEVRWSAPSNMALRVGSTPAGQPREAGQPSHQAHLFTPETEKTTHYWFGVGFPKSMGEEAKRLAATRIKGVRHPFEMEDLPMLEAQQLSMGDAEFWSLKPVLLPSDAAGVQVRRTLDKMIAEERAAP